MYENRPGKKVTTKRVGDEFFSVVSKHEEFLYLIFYFNENQHEQKFDREKKAKCLVLCVWVIIVSVSFVCICQQIWWIDILFARSTLEWFSSFSCSFEQNGGVYRCQTQTTRPICWWALKNTVAHVSYLHPTIQPITCWTCAHRLSYRSHTRTISDHLRVFQSIGRITCQIHLLSVRKKKLESAITIFE